jgi:hypothetical protein
MSAGCSAFSTRGMLFQCQDARPAQSAGKQRFPDRKDQHKTPFPLHDHLSLMTHPEVSRAVSKEAHMALAVVGKLAELSSEPLGVQPVPAMAYKDMTPSVYSRVVPRTCTERRAKI